MSLLKYLERLDGTDFLIRKKATGNAASLAKKLNLSKAGLYKFIHEMREPGFPIAYCRKRKTYYYTEEGKMAKNLFEKEINKEEMRKINGGKTFFKFSADYNYSRQTEDNFTL
jgi:predicted DNA-binding transcriptional regulator YafY